MLLIATIAISTVATLAFVRYTTGSLGAKETARVFFTLAIIEFVLCFTISFPFPRGGIGTNAAIFLVAAIISGVLAGATYLTYLDQPTPAVQRSRRNRQQRVRH
jgi:FtsH-binding integral membrane protein